MVNFLLAERKGEAFHCYSQFGAPVSCRPVLAGVDVVARRLAMCWADPRR